MAAPTFILTKGMSNLTDKPYYLGTIQHSSVMSKEETYAFLTERLAFSDGTILTHTATIAASPTHDFAGRDGLPC